MFAKGDVSGALRALEECVKRTPNNSAMLNDYGVALLADKPPQIRPAIAAFTEAVDLGGNSQASYNRYVSHPITFPIPSPLRALLL